MEINSNNNVPEESQYSFSEIYYLFKKHFKLILIVFLFITISSIYYTLIKKPIYRASTIIMVSEDQKSMSMLDMGLGKDRNYIENEIQILKGKEKSDYDIYKKELDDSYKRLSEFVSSISGGIRFLGGNSLGVKNAFRASR